MQSQEHIYNQLLVLRCRRGHKPAFEELVKIWEKRLLYYIRRLIEDEQQAWQVLQETWLEVLKSMRRLKDPARFPAWLYSIARHKAIDVIRAQYKQAIREEGIKNENYQHDDNGLNTFEDVEQVHYGLSKIALHQREILTLFFLEDLSLTDIAEVLSIPMGTAKSRLHYAKQALKTVLEKEGN
jgi:RNA polymerase sigma-70 factor, ECF subfamily